MACRRSEIQFAPPNVLAESDAHRALIQNWAADELRRTQVGNSFVIIEVVKKSEKMEEV